VARLFGFASDGVVFVAVGTPFPDIAMAVVVSVLALFLTKRGYGIDGEESVSDERPERGMLVDSWVADPCELGVMSLVFLPSGWTGVVGVRVVMVTVMVWLVVERTSSHVSATKETNALWVLQGDGMGDLIS
jgi:hypothetical protein